MHIHTLGICGTFMGGIAAIAKAAGHAVTGCDANVYPPMSTQLEAQGIKLVEGFGVEQLDLKPDVYVIGNVVARGNALMEEILNRGLPFISGPQWLAENVLRGRWVLAVAGTHGKTTTTAMLAWILEYDHADIFPDLAAIESQFHHLVRTVPGAGLIVSNGADANLERVLARGAWTPVERFAVAAGWQAGAQSADGRFAVGFNGKPVGEVQWDLLGVHNQLNALAAIAAARHAGVAPAVAIEALAAFENVKRRLELRGTVDGISVYDDFAHHPTAIRTTLAGLRAKTSQLPPPARILAVLEPRSNTMKLGVMKDALAGSLADADRVFCYGAGLGWDPSAALAPLGAKAEIHQDIATLVAAIAHEAKAGDHVLVMSNGGFGGIHDKLLHQLGARHG